MSELEKRLLALAGPIDPRTKVGKVMRRQGVPWSAEFDRIAAIPRRAPLFSAEQAQQLTELLRVPGGTFEIRPPQALMLTEAFSAGGLFAAVGVGWGKTFVAPLFAEAMDSERCVWLVPVSMKEIVRKNVLPLVRQHFRIRDCIHVVSYTDISRPEGDGLLESIGADLIIADEVHELKRKQSARTRRFLRYFSKRPRTRLVAMSGTITTKSLRDYAHILELCLRMNAPAPTEYRVLEDWAGALDATTRELRLSPGVLLRFCEQQDRDAVPADAVEPELSMVRHAYRRRLVETPGVVATVEASLGTSLILKGWKPELAPEIDRALFGLRDTWQTPAGEDLTEAIEFAAHARQIAAGFFYRWRWPNDVVDEEWLEARSKWKRYVRDAIRYNRRGWDTELFIVRALDSGELKDDGPALLAHWRQVRDRYKPDPYPVWLSRCVVDAAVKWAKEETGIVWYEHTAVGEQLAASGLTTYGAGNNVDLEREMGTRSIAASLHAHGQGKNLQMFAKNLIIGCPPNGKTWEQLLGRTHRPGQDADEVTAEIFQSTLELKECFDKAQKDARYISETTGVGQKLLYANLDDVGTGS